MEPANSHIPIHFSFFDSLSTPYSAFILFHAIFVHIWMCERVYFSMHPPCHVEHISFAHATSNWLKPGKAYSSKMFICEGRKTTIDHIFRWWWQKNVISLHAMLTPMVRRIVFDSTPSHNQPWCLWSHIYNIVALFAICCFATFFDQNFSHFSFGNFAYNANTNSSELHFAIKYRKANGRQQFIFMKKFSF